MEYKDMCQLIEKGMRYFYANNNIYPNELIISIDLLNILKTRNSVILKQLGNGEFEYTFLGLAITVETQRKGIIKIGSTETVNI